MIIDYYKILNIDRNIEDREIKKYYRKLAFKYHPDVSKDPNSHARFIEIQEAYEILGDIGKRVRYNYLYDIYFPKGTIDSNYSELYERKVYDQYTQWRKDAADSAMEKSKESFSKFKEGFFESIGQGIGKGFDLLSSLFAIIVGCMIVGGTFVNLNDYLAGNKESIWGVLICGILSIFMIAGLVAKLREL